MTNVALAYDAGAYLDRSFEAKGVGGWRALYLKFIADLQPQSVLECGAGAPDFLGAVDAPRRIAVDIGDRFAAQFRAAGIHFVSRDLDRERLADLGPVELAICSDVFEHLINPQRALDHIAEALAPEAVFLNHVPNEYRLGHTLKVMFGGGKTVLFHDGHEEWEDPHFRRFSDMGYRALLSRRFRYNLRLTDLRYDRAARLMEKVGLSAPYCLQGGPTYASTNSAAMFQRLGEIKRRLKHG